MSSSAYNDVRVGEFSPYSAGDYFELPVRLRRGLLGVAPVYFIGAIRDTRTGTWLVSVLRFAQRLLLMLV